ncbi:hypothetical protein HOO14_07845 [bacterium]|nr:hypothetical protein [bacterium]
MKNKTPIINKYIVADVSVIRDQGINHFRGSENWPVAEEEYQEFSKYMYQQYEDLMFELKGDLFDIALIDYKFQGSLLKIFHYNYMKNYAHKSNIDILFGVDSQDYLNPDWNKLGKQYSLFSPYYSKLTRVIRRVVKNVVFNRHLPIHKVIYSFFSSKNYIFFGSNSGLAREYVVKNKICCDYQDVYDVLSFDTNKESLVNQHCQDIMNKLISPYLEKLKANQPMFLDGIDIRDIKLCWGNRFKEMTYAYVNILDSDSGNKFLVTEVASAMHRVASIGYQRIGCKVLGFHHGGDFAATILSQMHKGSMTHCKNIIVPTQGIADQYKKVYSCLELEKRTGTKYYSVSPSKLLYNSQSISKSKKKIKSVMLIGFPMNCDKKTDERGLFFVQKINIEYDILTMLRKLGLNVLYKAHPDRKNEVYGLFDNIADKVIYDAFENSWKEADAFIFTYTSTTTFAFALETNRRVVLIDVDTNIVDKGLRQELGKRVDYVPATITDSNNLIKFDKRKLKECLLL